MFAILLPQEFQSDRLIYLILSICLCHTSHKGYSQKSDSLISQIQLCETRDCLDVIKTLDIRAYLNETKLGKTLLRTAMEKARSLDYQEIMPHINKAMAGLFYYQGAFDSSFYYRIEAIKQFEVMNQRPLAGREYSELGYQYKRINLDKGFEYMKLGLDILEEEQDSLGLANTYNNIGVLYEMKGARDSAMFYYESSLSIKTGMNDSLGLPYSLENIAHLQILDKNYEQAESNLNLALSYRLAINDQQGLLGNYINLAELFAFKNELRKSIAYFHKALKKEQQIGHSYASQYCYEKMTEVYQKLGDYKLALESHINYTQIKDSISNQQNIKNAEALAVQYETEKKEQEIELLSVQNLLKDTQLEAANNRFTMLVGGIGLLVLIAFLWLNRYKQKQRALLAEEKAINQRLGFKSLIEGEEKERKRIAQELHDGLGQLLSTARLNVSAMEDRIEEIVIKQWENSIKLIDDAVTEVRHISHNMMPNALISIGFEAAIKEQVHILNDTGKIKVHAEMPEEKIDLPESEAIALYRVIQEVLNNAIKYANAKNIWLTITTNGTLTVSIKDDGRGFDTQLIQNSEGLGWQSIRSRMEILNGELDVSSESGKGAEIKMKIAI